MGALLNDEKLRKKHPIPDDFNFLIARRLFSHPEVTEVSLDDMVQQTMKEDELRSFLL